MTDFPNLVMSPSGTMMVQGTGISVDSIIDLMNRDKSEEEIIRLFPDLSRKIIEEIRNYKAYIETKVLFSTQNLSKKYGNVFALNDLTYSTTARSIGLFGPNGSGKSTLIKILLGLVFPTSGSYEFNYEKRHVRVVPDFPSLPKSLTIDQWLDMLEEIYGPPMPDFNIEKLFGLDLSQVISTLSAGQTRIVALMPIFFGTVKLIILDEPTNFLDAFIRDKMLTMIKKQIVMQRSRMIIATHRIDEINMFAERVLMLHKGKMIADVPTGGDIQFIYQVKVSHYGEFVKLLDKSDVAFDTVETAEGKLVVLELLDKVWKVLQDYLEQDMTIHSIERLDKLVVMLGEVMD